MRAGRLLSLLMLLQTRGRMSATELARALEVSPRTVYRDIESLSSAGVPVYADQGRAGGYQLLDGYRTRLTGLTGAEAEALAFTGMPGPATDLGLSAELTAAELKLMAALPPELASRAARIRECFHLDARAWFRESEGVPQLAELANAVWDNRVVRVRYRRWGDPPEVERTLWPLGVVLKGGVWYLVARSRDRDLTYRASRVLEVIDTGTTFERPKDFDLASFWKAWAERFEIEQYRMTARIRLSPAGMALVPYVLGFHEKRVVRATAGEPDSAGWVTADLPIETIEIGHTEVLKLGAHAEVLEPQELRDRLAATARALAETYSSE
ncbi:YafY family protein [Allokutzneria sp. NRRL B-24872]|uniref:helix-turn-helix transcriptional regulator n=1 Tax=Allokutzneria sp. NRRL B-24872 TaxID=1137961 RepID=UPI000A37B5D8|nr:WYL domain-containing protein [Allokutzneria sp. NRRL B-24872]